MDKLETLQVIRSTKLLERPWRMQVSEFVLFREMGKCSLPPGLFLNEGARLDFFGTDIDLRDPRLAKVVLLWLRIELNDLLRNPERITVPEILQTQNTAVRNALYSRMGVARFMAESGAEIVDQDRDAGGLRQLLRVPVPRAEDVVVLKVVCPTTAHEHHLRVPPGDKKLLPGRRLGGRL